MICFKHLECLKNKMETHIMYIAKKESNGLTYHLIDKLSKELENSKSKLERIGFTYKTPDGKKLEQCVFHSHYTPYSTEGINLYKRCMEGIEDFAICTKDFIVYDTCHILEQKRKDDIVKQSKIMHEKLSRYENGISTTYQIHSDFMINYDRRRELLQRKMELEKIYGKENKLEENPEYITLFQILQKAEEQYEHSRTKLEKIYNLKPQDISLDEFVDRSSREEAIKVDKAKAILTNWCNKQQKTPMSKEQELLLILTLEIEKLNKLLHSTFELSCAYMYKAIRTLDDLKHYFKSDYRFKETVKEIENDLETCKRKFEIYQEFVNLDNIETVIAKVERSQRQAAAEERKAKDSSTVQKVFRGPSLVVKLDGTVSREEIKQPVLILGQANPVPEINGSWRKS